MPEDLSQSHAEDVLRRAALLQARSESDTGAGLSMAEVKRAAAAAGIDARYVEQAFLGAGDDLPPSEPFLGIETGVQRVRVVPGPVSELEWGRMVMALRREFGSDGEAETLGGTREWKAYQTRVTLEPDGPNTRMTASGEWGSDAKVPLYASVFYAALAGLIAGGTALTDGTVAWGLIAAILVLALLHVGFVVGPVRKRARTRGRQLDRALDSLGRLAGSDERAAALEGGSLASPVTVEDTSGEPRVDASLLDAAAPDAESASEARRERVRE